MTEMTGHDLCMRTMRLLVKAGDFDRNYLGSKSFRIAVRASDIEMAKAYIELAKIVDRLSAADHEPS